MNANEIIRMIADDLNMSPAPATDPRSMIALQDIKAALEDGAALLAYAFGDDVQQLVEDAHDLVSGWIDAGIAYYHDAA